jgi:hypothetical protein
MAAQPQVDRQAGFDLYRNDSHIGKILNTRMTCDLRHSRLSFNNLLVDMIVPAVDEAVRYQTRL